jgi:hypothetical protein
MFDRVVVQPQQTRVEYVTKQVDVKRAPTDESVKLLREMEQAAMERVISAGKIENNLIHADWRVFQSQTSFGVKVHYRIRVNGTERRESFDVDDFLNVKQDCRLQALADEVRKHILEMLAKLITEDFFRSAVHEYSLWLNGALVPMTDNASIKAEEHPI